MTSTKYIFISYARADGSDFAQCLYSDLKKRNIPAWLDVHHIEGGESFYKEIEHGIENAIAMVVVLTPASILSQQVMAEWNSALNLHLPIIPLLVIDCDVPDILSVLNWIDFQGTYAAGLAALRRRLKHIETNHLIHLEEQLKGYIDAQAASSKPQQYQYKVDDLTNAIARWKMLSQAEQEKTKQQKQYIQQVTQSRGYRKDMEHVFVGRKIELKQLRTYLDKVLHGNLQVCLVTGEAGAGKSTLLRRFSKDAETADEQLLFVVGNCNAQTGISDHYLPFRQIIAQLTGNVNVRVASDTITEKGKQRFNDVFKTTGRALVEIAPELIGALIPGAGILTALGKLAAEERGLLSGLEKQAKQAEKQPPQLEQSQIMYQYTELLRNIALDYPLVIVLDDLQWADEATIALFFHLTRELQDSKVMIIGLYRPNDIAMGRQGERHPMDSIINEIKRYSGDILVDLDKAKELEGRAFVDDFLDIEANDLHEDFRQKLYQQTNGHPLFISELVRSMQERGDLIQNKDGQWVASNKLIWDELPTRTEAVIEERIERLEDDLREVLAIASIEGQTFTVQVVEQIQEMQKRKLLKILSGELDKRHKLVQEEKSEHVGDSRLFTYSFSHALFQQYMYASLSTAERETLHEDVAHILEELYGDNKEQIALQLAHHYREAGNSKKFVEYIIIVSKQALKIGGAKDIISMLEDALTAKNVSQLSKGKVCYYLGNAHRRIGNWKKAEQYCLESLAYLQDLGDIMLLQVMDTLASLYIYNGQYQNALDYHQRVIQLAGTSRDEELQKAKALHGNAIIFSRKGDKKNSEQFRMLAYEIAERHEDFILKCNILNSRAISEKRKGNLSQAMKLYQDSLANARQDGNRHSIAMVMSNMGYLYHTRGHYDKALKYNWEALKISQQLGNPQSSAFRLECIARIYLHQSNIQKASKYALSAYEIAKKIHHIQLQSYTTDLRGLLHLIKNDEQAALAMLQETMALNYQNTLVKTSSLYALSLLRTNDREQALFHAKNVLLHIDESERDPIESGYFEGFALSILALLSVGKVQAEYLEKAQAKYSDVIDINTLGFLQEQRILIKELMKADSHQVLMPIQSLLNEM